MLNRQLIITIIYVLTFPQVNFAQHFVDSIIAKHSIKSATTSIFIGSNAAPTSVVVFTFDQYGKVTYLVNRNKNGKICQKKFYTRTENGKYQSELHSFSCFSETNLDSSVTKYDESGELDDSETKIVTVNDSLNKPRKITKTYPNKNIEINTFSYDKFGRTTLIKSYYNGKLGRSNKYLYNGNGQMTCIIYSMFDYYLKIAKQEKNILTYTKSGLVDKQVYKTVIGKGEYSEDTTIEIKYQ